MTPRGTCTAKVRSMIGMMNLKPQRSSTGKYVAIVLVVLGVVSGIVGVKTWYTGETGVAPVTQPADLAVPD
jgi:hypothetical protein